MKIKILMSKVRQFTKECKRWIKVLKNPCKKCLVQATCNHRVNCDLFNDYILFLDLRTSVYTLLFVIGVLFFIISTFTLGLYQWCQIIGLI